MKILFLIYLVHTALSIQNDSPTIKGCPPVSLMKSSISIDRITGKWYEIAKHASSFATGNCISINLTLLSNVTVSFTYSQRFDNDARRNYSVSYVNATVIKSDFWACSYKSLYAILDGYIFILDTDYNNFAIILGCGSVGKKGVKMTTNYGYMVWVLSRTSQLGNDFMSRVNSTLTQNNLTLALRTTNQNDCTDNDTTTEQTNAGEIK